MSPSGPTEDIRSDQSAHPQSPSTLLWLTHNSAVTCNWTFYHINHRHRPVSWGNKQRTSHVREQDFNNTLWVTSSYSLKREKREWEEVGVEEVMTFRSSSTIWLFTPTNRDSKWPLGLYSSSPKSTVYSGSVHVIFAILTTDKIMAAPWVMVPQGFTQSVNFCP